MIFGRLARRINLDRHCVDVVTNLEAVNDRAKLIMHRLIARRLAHDPGLVDVAKATVARLASDHPDSSFAAEWRAILDQPPGHLRRRLTSRADEMRRLRLSSPFVVNEAMAHLANIDVRRRIWQLARKGAAKPSAVLSAPV